MYSAVANLTFTEVTETASNHGELRYAESDAPSTAWAYYPSTTPSAATSGSATRRTGTTTRSRATTPGLTMIHETGHAMGLKHPHETGSFGAMPVDHDFLEYSVMSYRSYIGASTSSGYTNGCEQLSADADDVRHRRAAGRCTAPTTPPTAATPSTRWIRPPARCPSTASARACLAGNKIFMTLWDGGGNDTYDFSNYATNLSVNLNPGAWTTASATQLATLGNGHYAAGNIANALLYNGNTASLIENVDRRLRQRHDGRQRADNQLTGGRGNDTLDGGPGADTAMFSGNQSDYTVMHNARRQLDRSPTSARPPTAPTRSATWNSCGSPTRSSVSTVSSPA